MFSEDEKNEIIRDVSPILDEAIRYFEDKIIPREDAWLSRDLRITSRPDL